MDYFLIRLKDSSDKEAVRVYGQDIDRKGVLFFVPKAAITPGIENHPDLDVIHFPTVRRTAAAGNMKNLVRVRPDSAVETVEVSGHTFDKTGTTRFALTVAMKGHPDLQVISYCTDLGLPPEAAQE